MKKRLRAAWESSTTYLISLAFTLSVAVYLCLDINYTDSHIIFDVNLLPRTLPIILTYVALAFWFFPRFVHNRKIYQYVVGSVGFVIVISLVWSIWIRPLMPLSYSEQEDAALQESVIYFDNQDGFDYLKHLVDERNHTGEQVVDSCKARTRFLLSDYNSTFDHDLPFRRWIFYFLLCFVTLVEFSAIHFISYGRSMEREKARLEKEKAMMEKEIKVTELQVLKSQLNPHFMMNTLNNIYALIGEDTERAQESVLLLSHIMRYIHQEINTEWVTLDKEVESLRCYFDLMRMRFTDKVDIRFDIQNPLPPARVAPALYLNLAGNAFKHGISYQDESFVHLKLYVENETIYCSIRNSKPINKRQVQSTGYGLDSLLKRLEQIYPNRYYYHVTESDTEYYAELNIPRI